MANEGATEFGSIKAILTLDKSDYVAGLKEAGVQADELGRHDPKIHVDVNAAEVIAKIKAIEAADDRLRAARERTILAETRLNELRGKSGVSASRLASATVALSNAQRAEAATLAKVTSETERAEAAETKRLKSLGDGNDKVGRKARESQRSVSALMAAVIMLGPALVPLAAGATGLAAALGGMGVAGVLAIVGIAREMKQGTALGLEYQATVDDLQGSIQTLSHTAAAKVLGPFQETVADLQRRTPELTGQIGDLATMTGKAGANVVTGLVAAFVLLNPLMQDASVYVLDLTKRFQSAMSGQGVVAFGDYIRSVFPQVMQDVESIVTAAVHLVAALAPLGTGTLSMLGLLSQLISDIPVDVLAVLAQLASGVYLGFKTWQGLSGLIGGVSTAMERLGVKASTAAGAVRGLQAAAGIVGVAIAALSWIVSANAEANRQNQQAVDDYSDALRQSNGVIDENIRKMTAKKLADDGVLDAGKKLGITLSDLTDAALGVPGAMDRVNAVIDAHGAALTQTANSGRYAAVVNSDLGNSANKVRDAIGQTNGQLDAAIQKNKDIAAATADSTTQISNQATAVQTLADKYGVSVPTYQSVVTHQKDIADKAAAATLQMQLENNAAGLLKQSLDLLNGKALDAAQTQNAFDSSLANMGDHVTAQGKKIKFTTTSIKDMSAASVALRGQLLGQVQNAENAAAAYGQMTGSTEKGRLKLIDLRKQIIDNAVAHGVDRDAVIAYIDQVLKVPAKVPPTKMDIDTAAALAKKKALQDAINAITGKTVQVTIQQVYQTLGQKAALSVHNEQTLSRHGINPNLAGGGKIPGYATGTIVGPGTGTSDSILAMVAQTGRFLRVSAGEHVSTAASARRNSAALEAGNRGAALQVAGAGRGMSRREMKTLARYLGDEIRRMPAPEVAVQKMSTALAGDY